jgi:hypothetical protein
LVCHIVSIHQTDGPVKETMCGSVNPNGFSAAALDRLESGVTIRLNNTVELSGGSWKGGTPCRLRRHVR